MNSPTPETGKFASAIRLEGKSLSFKVVRGVLFSFARKVITGPLFILIIPFTLHRVGKVGYGTWAILGGVINVSWFLDFGLGLTAIKYVAEYGGSKDLDYLRRVLHTASALYCGLALAAVGVLGIGSPVIVRALFRSDVAVQTEVLALWPLLLVTVAVDILARPFYCTINGLQRMDLTNVLLFLRGLSNSIFTLVFLLGGGKVGGLLWSTFLSSFLASVGAVLVTRNLLPAVVPNPFRCDTAILKKMCTFSLALSAGLTTTTIQAQLEKFYLARLVGVVPAGLFDVASEAASKVRRLPDLLLSPLMAAASELHAAQEPGKLRELYLRSNKYFAVLAVPLVVFALFFAKLLITVWLGPDMTSIALPFAGLAVGYFFVQFSGPAYAILMGKGILQPGVYASLLAGILNIALSFVFIRLWGFQGAMFGTALPMIISTSYYFIVASPHTGIPFLEMTRKAYLKPLVCSILAALAARAVPSLTTRPWQTLLLSCAFYGTLYLLGLLLTRFFDAFDFAKAHSALPFLSVLRRTVLGHPPAASEGPGPGADTQESKHANLLRADRVDS